MRIVYDSLPKIEFIFHSLAEQGNPANREDCDNVNGVNDPVRIFAEIRKVLCFA